MEKDTSLEYESKISKGISSHHFHKMGNAQWDYADELAEEAVLIPLPRVVSKIYLDCHYLRRSSLMFYKTNKYTLMEDGSFKSSLRETDSEEL